MNDKQAELLGAPASTFLGKKVTDLPATAPALKTLFERVAAGEWVHNAIVKQYSESVSNHRAWLVNVSPVLGASGGVEAYTWFSLEIPGEI